MSDQDKPVGFLNGRVSKPLRLPPEIIRQVDEVRKVQGLTFQTFVQIAIKKAIVEARAENEKDQQQRISRRDETRRSAAPKGLGIRERLEQEEGRNVYGDEPTEYAPAAPQAPVVVNVGTSAAPGGGSNDINTLARMVVEGPRHDRRRLLESACKALAKSAHSTDESVQLAEQLDAEIKRLDVPKTALERVRDRMSK